MWEYKVVYLTEDGDCYDHRDENGDEVLVPLNELGKEGWELTGTLTIEEVPVGFFKRSIPIRGEIS